MKVVLKKYSLRSCLEKKIYVKFMCVSKTKKLRMKKVS
jgi:hypothetical protein